MTNLKNLYTGRKLIKEIMETLDKNNGVRHPWSREKQEQQISKQKNIKPKSK